MAEVWPAPLQQLLNVSDFSYNLGETSVTSNVDAGPVKKRRIISKPVDTINCSINMSYTNWQLLWNFFNINLNGGVNQFEAPHPFTGETQNYRFVGTPKISPLGSGGREYRVSMVWEVML